MNVKIKKIGTGKLPEKKREGDVCFDCYSRRNIPIAKGKRELVQLGFALELPDYYEAVIRPRSGYTKDGLDVAIGTIDTNYRGEVMVALYNQSDKEAIPYSFKNDIWSLGILLFHILCLKVPFNIKQLNEIAAKYTDRTDLSEEEYQQIIAIEQLSQNFDKLYGQYKEELDTEGWIDNAYNELKKVFGGITREMVQDEFDNYFKQTEALKNALNGKEDETKEAE